MIEVNIARGYSGSYIVHWEDPADGDSGCEWVHSQVMWEVFRTNSEYMDMIHDAWKLIPTKRSRPTRTVLLQENARGELKELMNKLKRRREDGGLDRPAKGTS